MYKLFLYFDLGRINVINYTQEGFTAMQTSVQHEAEKCKNLEFLQVKIRTFSRMTFLRGFLLLNGI